LISEPEILNNLLSAAKQVGIPREKVWVFDNEAQTVPPDQKSWKTLMKHGEEDWVRFNDLKTAETTTAARLFSSGTTGLPKAVVITHYNLIAQHELVIDLHPRPYPVSQHQPR
jgi:acyl-CoA synthetase (AMP-forming)/AMP-acid ligase II